MGDFNFLGIKWVSNDDSGNEEQFLECIQDSFFTHHVLLPTRGDNILNLVMSNEEGLVENLTVDNLFGTSDHCVIKWDMEIKILEIRTVTELSLIILMWIMHSWEKLHRKYWSEIIKGCNVEDDWGAFKKVIIDIRDNYISKKRVIKFRLKQNG